MLIAERTAGDLLSLSSICYCRTGMRDMVQQCTVRAAFLASVACKILGRCFGSIDHTCNVSKLQCRTSASLMRLHSQRINEVISSDRLWAAGAHPDTFSLLRDYKMLFFFWELLGVTDLSASWKERRKSRMIYRSFIKGKCIHYTHIQKQTHTHPLQTTIKLIRIRP